ncbi:MAG TPA: ABC transporter permease [Candidatus Limnocylindrales bacterium]|nr:ABC transporter permease [Candidatus Limnocylindrales bacterium]
MDRRRLAAVTRRVIDGIRRDHRTLALIIIVPLVITILLGWIIRGSSTPEIRLLVVNADGQAGALVSDALLSATNTAPIVVIDGGSDPAVATQRIADGDADVALIIPEAFGTDILAGTQPTIRVVTPGIAPADEAGDVAQVGVLVSSTLQDSLPPEISARIPTIVRETVYLPPDADALDSLAPVFLGYFAYFFVFILTGVSFLRERIGGTLERLLATPVTRGEIVLGYSIAFGLFATLQVLLLTAYVLAGIEVPAIGPLPAFTIGLDVVSAGSVGLILAIALALAFGAVSLGIFLSTFARTELQVIQFIPIVIVPQGLLGGIFWPIENLPELLQPIARVLPVTYAVEGLRAVMITGADLASRTVQIDLAVLAAIALIFVVLAARTIRREIA